MTTTTEGAAEGSPDILDVAHAILRPLGVETWEAYGLPDAPGRPAHSVVAIGDREIIIPWLEGSYLIAHFIVSARELLPALIAEVEALRAQLAESRAHPADDQEGTSAEGTSTRFHGGYRRWIDAPERAVADGLFSLDCETEGEEVAHDRYNLRRALYLDRAERAIVEMQREIDRLQAADR